MKIHPQRNFLRVHLFCIHNDIVSMVTNLDFEKKFQTGGQQFNQYQQNEQLSTSHLKSLNTKKNTAWKSRSFFGTGTKNVAGFNHLIDPNNFPIKCIIKKSMMFNW